MITKSHIITDEYGSQWHKCEKLPPNLANNEDAITGITKTKEDKAWFAVQIGEGFGTQIAYCPFCGTKLE